ncbi:F0F1 ATP synthase subunit gamma [Wohlfahrtiimonas chitiniclastica]|uniref:F0F1 ATP synthase subunit gamma n=1 Tax=Wohlfahrtiimonas chitiniclastica TaxID=400946 RepID=UPI000B98AD5A|nr:F0F1 ATP synthase subunit gamma [Wohlfahrtiimonas chitiniclastica]OYQ82311.1 F0F1 ATP synthase subunit gamma [Wohlfahrtiimonas chitiniclastica]
MAVGKEIRTKIKSVKNTQKITGAMQMVAASKMRKTQTRMLATKPYTEQIVKLVSHLSQAEVEFDHVYLTKREVKKIGIIVVSSDRGLCGGLNNNLFKLLSADMAKWSEQGIDVEFATIGNKANTFFNRYGGKILATVSHLGDQPSMADLLGVMNVMLTAYRDGEIDELHIYSNAFVNTMVQKPYGMKLLPLDLSTFKSLKAEFDEKDEIETIDLTQTMKWDYIYDMDPKKLVELVLNRYLESTMYHSVIANIACEMAARMVAMQAATDNAEAIVDNLQLVYNKARQAAITQEISEIVGGAAAL